MPGSPDKSSGGLPRTQAGIFATTHWSMVLVAGDTKGESSYAEIAVALKMSEGAIKVAVHRLRQRYGELVRAEIAQTVATQEEVDEELDYLFSVLRD